MKTLTQAEIDAIRDKRFFDHTTETSGATGELTTADFNRLLDEIYKTGGSCDFAYISYENAYHYGIIGWWTYQWLKLRQKVRRSLGTLKRNVISGVRSALRTRGTGPMGPQ